MAGAMAYRQDDAIPESPSSAHEAALRLMLEEARQLAAQSRLLALNTALESADAGREAGVAGEMGTLGSEAGQAAEEAEKIVTAVDLLLRQIHAASSASRAL